MDLVTNYTIEYKSDLLFDLKFDIPSNCMYSVAVSGKINNITVQLQPGQTVPSTTFLSHKLSLATIDTLMNVSFYQIQNGKTSIKPKIKVETC